MPTRRLTATDNVRSEIDALFVDPDRELGEVLDHVATLSPAKRDRRRGDRPPLPETPDNAAG